MRRVGVWLVVTAYVGLLWTTSARTIDLRTHSHVSGAMSSEYDAPWPVILGSVVSGIGIVLALVPIRRGESWAVWTSFATLLALLAARLASDPRCRAVLDPHQHGCHTFMIAIVIGVIGLGLATPGRAH